MYCYWAKYEARVKGQNISRIDTFGEFHIWDAGLLSTRGHEKLRFS